MATTESRSGFRLPWSAERAPSRDGSEEYPADEPRPGDPELPASESEPIEATYPAFDPDAGAAVAEAEGADVEAPGPALEDAAIAAPAAVSASPVAAVTDPAPLRRPSKFLIDLSHAMQTAAEQARAATLEQFRIDGSSYVEQVHARSVANADAIRRHADEDVACIKDWSKAEIARIREETEGRVSGRRGQLDGQLARHAALVEQDVARIEAQIAAFETEMATFFGELLAETDVTILAARAQQMPEAPAFDELDDSEFQALLTEPAVGIPIAAPEPPAEPEPVAEPEPLAELTGAVAEADDEIAASATAADEPTRDLPFDPDAAMAAIQAAAEAAAALEAGDGVASEAEIPPTESEPAFEASPSSGSDTARATDPRLALLGLTSDFEAAEEAAAEAAAAEIQGIPEMDEQNLTARLAGLVPSSAAGSASDEPPAVPLVTTRVVVSGLVSVASIASFKRHLSRADGVRHVGVSSGPDGEFLFTVQHEEHVGLRDLIPALPGFQARVTGGGDGVVTATAHDPED